MEKFFVAPEAVDALVDRIVTVDPFRVVRVELRVDGEPAMAVEFFCVRDPLDGGQVIVAEVEWIVGGEPARAYGIYAPRFDASAYTESQWTREALVVVEHLKSSSRPSSTVPGAKGMLH